MNFRKGNMFYVPENEIIIVTTNSIVLANGCLVMGAGAALQARNTFWWLPEVAGKTIRESCGSMGIYGTLILQPIDNDKEWDSTSRRGDAGIFQTKTHYKQPSTLELIKYSTECLTKIAQDNPKQQYHLNYPGIGYGGLTPQEVRPCLKPMEKHNNVTIWTRK